MGLDMYLTRKTYFYNGVASAPWNEGITITNNPYGIEAVRVSEISEEVGYWRKFNALHKWFVDTCQDGKDDCSTHYVSREHLEDLVDTLKTITENNPIPKDETDPSGGDYFAKEMLPTSSGFFFGSTNYDKNYFSDVQDTLALITALLEEDYQREISGRGNQHFSYRSSW